MQSLYFEVAEKRVVYLGVSNAPAWWVAKANGVARMYGYRPFSVFQASWSIWHRDVEREILPMCKSEGLALQAYGVTCGGRFKDLIQGNNNKLWVALARLAEKKKATPEETVSSHAC